MTSKDLRNIAAYWGSPYSGDFIGFSPDEDKLFEHKHFEGALCSAVMTCIGGAENFKLHLRSVEKLTDEEIREIAFIDRKHRIKGKRRIKGIVYREKDLICIQYAPEKWVMTIPFVAPLNELNQPAAVGAYLQSIGVYVPGTIDPTYVKLI